MSFSSGKKKLSVIHGCSHYAGVHREAFHCTCTIHSSQLHVVRLVQTAATSKTFFMKKKKKTPQGIQFWI